MNCTTITCQSFLGTWLPREPQQKELPASVRNRQAAVEYLRVANRSADERERALLRRQAAELILPRPGQASWWL
jgi:hypothetical protein